MENELNLFNNSSLGETIERIEAKWYLAGDVPYPRFEPICSICGSNDILLKQWYFHRRLGTNSEYPARCDVSFKCKDCSLVWVHGVMVPKSMMKRTGKHYFKEYLRGELEIKDGKPIW